LYKHACVNVTNNKTASCLNFISPIAKEAEDARRYSDERNATQQAIL